MFKQSEKAITIQVGYGKCGPHAQAFSQTFVHENSKTEMRQRNRWRRQEEIRKWA